MRIMKSAISSIVFLALWGQEVQAKTVSVSDKAVQDKIVAAVTHERKVYGAGELVPGVLVGVWDGEGHEYVQGFGTSDLTIGAPFARADYVRIGSNTKTFVVSVILQLVDEGRLSLDDPLSKFKLGVPVPDSDKITIRQLCDMRSGLFEVYAVPELAKDVLPNSQWDPRQLVRWAVAQKPYFPPGQGYKYSNTNYLLLGLVIEAVTGHSVKQEIETRLLQPLKLDHTFYPADTDMSMPSPWAHGYVVKSDRVWEDFSNLVPVSMMGSAGNMISNLDDMKRWVELYVSGKTNSPATQKARLTCLPIGKENLGFGLGIGCGAGWYGNTGELPGYNTAAWLYPAQHVTVLVFVTLQSASPPPGVADAILRDIAGIVTPGHVPFEEAQAAPASGP